MNQLMLAWLITIVVEFFIYLFFIKKNPLKLFLYSALINSITVPLATYGYLNVLNNIFFMELIITLVESVLIMSLLKLNYKKALFISITANLVTTIIGFLL